MGEQGLLQRPLCGVHRRLCCPSPSIFTIEGFEIASAPDAEPVALKDNSLEERLTTTWQLKSFPIVPHSVTSGDSLDAVFKVIVSSAGAAGRKVVRAIDLA